MPIKPHDPDAGAISRSIPTHANDWLQQFVKHFELAFVEEVESLRSPSDSDFGRSAVVGMIRTLQDSGMNIDAIISMLGDIVIGRGEHPSQWTAAMSARRFALVDKQIQDRLSPREQFELARLTSAMRSALDTEANLPMEGARALHRQLVELQIQRKPR